MTFVLVHGAWQGGWAWGRLTPHLVADGHRVATPTLTGAGDRAHLLTPDVSLATHIEDVRAVLVDGDLRDVILVGHSYAGMVISGVADRCGDRISALAYLDAFFPVDGESAFDAFPATTKDLLIALAEEAGDGWRLPTGDFLLDIWGLHDPADRAWVLAQLTDFSLHCFQTPASLTEPAGTGPDRLYVSATSPDYPGGSTFAPIATKAERAGCRVVGMDTGHDMMIEQPKELAQLLLDLT